MIKVKTDMGEVNIESEGNGFEIAADGLITTVAIYNHLCGRDEAMGASFRKTLTKMVESGELFQYEPDTVEEVEDES